MRYLPNGIFKVFYLIQLPLAFSSLQDIIISLNEEGEISLPLDTQNNLKYHYCPPSPNPKKDCFSKVLWMTKKFPLKGLKVDAKYVQIDQEFEKMEFFDEKPTIQNEPPDCAAFEILDDEPSKKDNSTLGADRKLILALIEKAKLNQKDVSGFKESPKYGVRVRIKRPALSKDRFFLYSVAETNLIKFPETSTVDNVILTVYRDEMLFYIPRDLDPNCDKQKVIADYIMSHFLPYTAPSMVSVDLPINGIMIQVDKPIPQASLFEEIVRLTSVDYLFRIQRWFHQPYSVRISVLPRERLPSSNFRLAISQFYDGESPFMFKIVSEAYSIILADDAIIIEEKSLPKMPPIKIILRKDNSLALSHNPKIPFNLILFRKDGKTPQNLSSIAQIEKIQDGDTIGLFTVQLETFKNPNQLPPFISHSTLNLTEVKRKFRQGDISIIVKIRKRTRTIKPYQKIYRLPIIPSQFLKSSSSLSITEVLWTTSYPEIPPSSVAFNEDMVVFGDAFRNLPVHRIQDAEEKQELKSRLKPLDHINTNDQQLLSGMIFELRGENLSFIGRIVKDTSFVVILNRKGPRELKAVFEVDKKNPPGSTRGSLFEVFPGDVIEIYRNLDTCLLEAYSHIYYEGYPLKSFKQFAAFLPPSNETAIMLTIGKRSSGNSSIISSNLNPSTSTKSIIKCNHWFDIEYPNEGGLVSMAKNNSLRPNSLQLRWSLNKLISSEMEAKYENYGVRIGSSGILVSAGLSSNSIHNPSKLHTLEYMKANFDKYHLIVDIKGLIPFTLALYRNKKLVISWNQPGLYSFDDFSLDDFLTLIPWSSFLLRKAPENVNLASTGNETFIKLAQGFSNGVGIGAIINFTRGVYGCKDSFPQTTRRNCLI